jgi:hypothetical protein
VRLPASTHYRLAFAPLATAMSATLTCAVLLAAPLARAAAQPVTAPPPLHGEGVAFDTARSRLVVFGGIVAGGERNGTPLPGTWDWDGHAWTIAADSAAGPSPRAGHAMTYDATNHRILLFGGRAIPGNAPLCDTWSYEGRRWTRLIEHDCPLDRSIDAQLLHLGRDMPAVLLEGPALPFDSAQRRLRIWALGDGGWRLVDSLGPRRVGFGRAAWDASRKRLVVPVLYGGDDAGVWEWDGRTWMHRASNATSKRPSTRQTYALAFDPVRRTIVLAGGQGSSRGPYLADVWSWNGTSWTELAPAGVTPAGRGGAHLLSDPANRRLLYFGGYAEQVLAELWALGDSAWMRLAP